MSEKGPFTTEDKNKVEEFVNRKRVEQENKYIEELEQIFKPLYDALDSFNERLKEDIDREDYKQLNEKTQK